MKKTIVIDTERPLLKQIIEQIQQEETRRLLEEARIITDKLSQELLNRALEPCPWCGDCNCDGESCSVRWIKESRDRDGRMD